MSKANPSVPTELDNPDLARDMRALANRLLDQRSRYENEHARNPLAALFTVALAFDGLARDLRRIADHCQSAEDPDPTAATAWIGGSVVTLRTRPDGTVTQADVDAFHRECAEAADAMRRGSHGTIHIVGGDKASAIGLSEDIKIGGAVIDRIINESTEAVGWKPLP